MPSPKVVAIVINFRTAVDTLEAVASLKGMDYDNLEIIVIDNASHDDIGDKISKEYPDVHFIKNEENLGFPGGCNVAIRAALQMSAEYVLLLNSDAVATLDMLREMIDLGRSEPEAGVIGPTILYDDESKVWYQGGTINRSLGYTRHPGMGAPALRVSSEPVSTDFVSGCAMLIKREVFETAGLLDEDYFLYVDDVDFSERARRAGFHVVYCPKAVARHKVSVSAGKGGSNVLTPLRAYYFARNMVLFISRHFCGREKWTALQGQIYVRAPYRLLFMALDGQLASMRPYLRGLWHGVMRVTGKWDQHDRWVS